MSNDTASMPSANDQAARDITAELMQHPTYLRTIQRLRSNENHAKDEESGDEEDDGSFCPPPEAERPKLTGAALYGPVGEIVRRLAPHTEADPAAMYAQLLTGLGSLIGRGAWFVADGAKHHVNLFTVIAGRTAKARKGTSWGRVEQVLSELDDPWFSNRVKSGVVSGEGVVEAFKEDEQDKRLLLMEGEFGQVLQCMKREGNTVSVLLRNAWDGKRIAVLRRKDPLEIVGAHISMIGHITLMELQRLLASVDISNGLANRCLWVHADRAQLLPDGGDNPDLEVPLDQLHAAIVAARTRGQMRRDADAGELWRQIYTELSEEPQGVLGEILSRSEAQVMRLALLLALLDRAAAIECRHLEAALAFWRYCEASAAFIFAHHVINPRPRKILDALQRGPLTLRQIHQLFANNASRSEIDQALAELSGRVQVQKNSGKGGGLVVRLAGG